MPTFAIDSVSAKTAGKEMRMTKLKLVSMVKAAG